MRVEKEMKLGQKVSEKQFGIRDETGIKSTETRWATVGFMRHTCTLNISYLNKYCIRKNNITVKYIFLRFNF